MSNLSDGIPCRQCEQGWHPGPHRQVINAGSAVAFWGDAPQVAEVAADAVTSKTLTRADGTLGPDGSVTISGERVTVYLWLRNPEARSIAERHWPRCNDIAVQFHREWAARLLEPHH